jgi:hypothetical protein
MEQRVVLEKALISGVSYRNSPAFELGSALVSPQKSQSGSDTYRMMRQLNPDDIVLHLINNAQLCGCSRVLSPAEEIKMGPELWYRVPLRGYSKITPPLRKSEIFDARMDRVFKRILSAGARNLFFTRQMRLRQGAYLTLVSAEVLGALDYAYRLANNISFLDQIPSCPTREAAFRFSQDFESAA